MSIEITYKYKARFTVSQKAIGVYVYFQKYSSLIGIFKQLIQARFEPLVAFLVLEFPHWLEHRVSASFVTFVNCILMVKIFNLLNQTGINWCRGPGMEASSSPPIQGTDWKTDWKHCQQTCKCNTFLPLNRHRFGKIIQIFSQTAAEIYTILPHVPRLLVLCFCWFFKK